MPHNNDPFSAFLWILGLGMSFLGALAKVAYDTINNKQSSFKIVICKLVVSMFAGSLAILLSSILDFTPELSGCMTGTAGWLGAEFIGSVAENMKNRIGKKE